MRTEDHILPKRPTIRELSPASEAGWLALLFVVAIFLFGVSLGRIGFEGKDERRYAQAAKEIAAGHGFFVMHYQRGLYPDKPPLFFWSQAAMFRLQGEVSPFGARFPLFLSSLGALAFAYLFMRRLDGPRRALIGTAMLLVCFRFLWAGRWARLDMMMCTFTFAALWVSALLIFRKPEDRPPVWLAPLAWVFGALAVLAKGPGVVVWLGTVVCYAIAQRDYSIIRRHRPVLGMMILLGIVGAWFVPAVLIGGRDYWGPMIGTHVVERLAGEVRHVRPWHYFFHKILYDTAPIGPMLPAALWWAWRQWHRSGERSSAQTKFLLCWLVFGMIFFSLPAGKRVFYILPVIPPMALLCARLLTAAIAERHRAAALVVKGYAWFAAGVFFLAAITIPGIRHWIKLEEHPIPPSYAVTIIAALIFLAGATLIVTLLRRHQLGSALLPAGAIFAFQYALYFGLVIPPNRDDTVPREVAAYLLEREEEPNLATWGLSDRFTLYGWFFPHCFDEGGDMERFVEWCHDSPGGYAILHPDMVEHFNEHGGDTSPWTLLREWEEVGHRRAVLFQLPE